MVTSDRIEQETGYSRNTKCVFRKQGLWVRWYQLTLRQSLTTSVINQSFLFNEGLTKILTFKVWMSFLSWLYSWVLSHYQHRRVICPENNESTVFGTYPDSAQWFSSSAAAAKSLQSCLTLCDPIDGSPPGSPVPGILQARTLEWVAISFSSAWKWKVKVKSFSCVQPLATSWTAAYQALHPLDFPGKSTGVQCHCLLHLFL